MASLLSSSKHFEGPSDDIQTNTRSHHGGRSASVKVSSDSNIQDLNHNRCHCTVAIPHACPEDLMKAAAPATDYISRENSYHEQCILLSQDEIGQSNSGAEGGSEDASTSTSVIAASDSIFTENRKTAAMIFMASCPLKTNSTPGHESPVQPWRTGAKPRTVTAPTSPTVTPNRATAQNAHAIVARSLKSDDGRTATSQLCECKHSCSENNFMAGLYQGDIHSHYRTCLSLLLRRYALALELNSK